MGNLNEKKEEGGMGGVENRWVFKEMLLSTDRRIGRELLTVVLNSLNYA